MEVKDGGNLDEEEEAAGGCTLTRVIFPDLATTVVRKVTLLHDTIEVKVERNIIMINCWHHPDPNPLSRLAQQQESRSEPWFPDFWQNVDSGSLHLTSSHQKTRGSLWIFQKTAPFSIAQR